MGAGQGGADAMLASARVFDAMDMYAMSVHTILIEQHHGDAVVVPIGWIHCVTNVQLCFKIAFDRVMPGDCAKVASPGH